MIKDSLWNRARKRRWTAWAHIIGKKSLLIVSADSMTDFRRAFFVGHFFCTHIFVYFLLYFLSSTLFRLFSFSFVSYFFRQQFFSLVSFFVNELFVFTFLRTTDFRPNIFLSRSFLRPELEIAIPVRFANPGIPGPHLVGNDSKRDCLMEDFAILSLIWTKTNRGFH